MRKGTAKNAKDFATYTIEEIESLADTNPSATVDQQKELISKVLINRLRDFLANGLHTDPDLSDETNSTLMRRYKQLMGLPE